MKQFTPNNSFNVMDNDGPIIFIPTRIEDNRGFFIKDYSKEVFQNAIPNIHILETFYSFSKKNVFRGFHFQYKVPQLKIVTCIKGRVIDFAIDLRKSSLNFKKVYSIELNQDNNYSFIIPKGFAHGFLALSDSIVLYKCDEPYNKEFDSGIIYNDKDFNLDFSRFGIREEDLIISTRDLSFKTLRNSFNLLDF